MSDRGLALLLVVATLAVSGVVLWLLGPLPFFLKNPLWMLL
jgi:cytochrome b subunit of formate dehydrogenase